MSIVEILMVDKYYVLLVNIKTTCYELAMNYKVWLIITFITSTSVRLVC